MGLFDGITDLLTGGNSSRAAGASQAAVDALAALQTPDIAQMQLELEGLVQQGVISPQQAQAFMQEKTGLSEIATDPRLRNAQMDALASLQETVDAGGMDAQARSRINEVMAETAAQERGSREAIMANARARGIGGSGMELAQQLMNQQASAGRASQQGFDVAAEAERRKSEALQQLASLGGNIRGQDFDEQARVAQAQDAINQFNTQNRQQVANKNVDINNAAQERNLAEKQRIADANAATRNQQQAANKQLIQQDFENRYKRAGGQSQALSNQAANYAQAGQRTQQLVGTGITAAAMYFSDEDLKENIEEFDAGDFLDSLTGYKYTYKDKKHGEGKQVGVMAQDLEKEAPQMVVDTPEGKMVDPSKSTGPMFAALANLNERLKKVEEE